MILGLNHHNCEANNIDYFDLKSCILIEVDDLSINEEEAGRMVIIDYE